MVFAVVRLHWAHGRSHMTEVMTRDLYWARKITERLRLQATNYAEAREKVVSTLTEARDGGAAELLGYASWTAYMAEVFGDAPLRLERDARQELVAELAAEGMSSRAIAPIVGVTDRQVRNDMAGGNNFPPEPAPEPEIVIHVDGDTGEVVTESEPYEPFRITGMDGKQYTRREPAAPKAEAVTSQFSSAITDLNRVLDRFHRIVDADAYRRNTETISNLHRADIARAIAELTTILNTL